MKKPIAIDLFCGAGGLTLGLKQAGFNVIGAVEIDDLACDTYTTNHQNVKLWQNDICKLSTNEIMTKLKIKKNQLDLLAGCPPCQGFSSMRTLNGSKTINDKRNDLIFEFMRFVDDMRPKFVMMENVPALINDTRMKQFQNKLDSTGYKWICKVINTADYGVPQRRRRMILLATRLNTSIVVNEKTNNKKFVRDAIANLPKAGKSGDPLHDFPENHSIKVIERIKKIPKNGGSRLDLPKSEQLKCHKKSSGFKDVYGRMAWNDFAPTITSGCVNPSKGRFLHPTEDRAITLREAALLQTFPKDYYFSLNNGKHKAALLIGNALPPEFIRFHAKSIINNLN